MASSVARAGIDAGSRASQDESRVRLASASTGMGWSSRNNRTRCHGRALSTTATVGLPARTADTSRPIGVGAGQISWSRRRRELLAWIREADDEPVVRVSSPSSRRNVILGVWTLMNFPRMARAPVRSMRARGDVGSSRSLRIASRLAGARAWRESACLRCTLP